MELQLNINQKLIVTPQMQQSIKILQMGAQELTEYVEQVSLENPVIEVAPNYAEIGPAEKLRRKLEWLDTLDKGNRVYCYENEESERSESFDFSNHVACNENRLQDHLLVQLDLLEISGDDYKIAEYLIECLDQNGYLDIGVEEVSFVFNTNPDKVMRLLKLIQSFEPYGVGARELRECLLLQLENRQMKTPLLNRLINEYLEKLSKNQWDVVAKEVGVTREEIKKAYSIIRSLNPRPGSAFSTGEKPLYIIPDIAVVKFNNYYEVLLEDFAYPKIAINRCYKNILDNTSDKETRKYIVKKTEQANWILKCIEERNSTLLSVARVIVEIQKAFFDRGPKFLTPMVLRDVAEKLTVHESTISRAVRDKYLQCAWGVFELKHFFSHGFNTRGNTHITAENIKLMIKEIIQGEDARKALSDSKIADLLNGKGIDISRRTVAKYREEMHIASTSGRKEA